jgi:DNA replication licensing factor MCM5
MDRRSVYTLSVGLGPGSQAGGEPDSRAHIQQQLIDFILDFRIDNAFIYR